MISSFTIFFLCFQHLQLDNIADILAKIVLWKMHIHDCCFSLIFVIRSITSSNCPFAKSLTWSVLWLMKQSFLYSSIFESSFLETFAFMPLPIIFSVLFYPYKWIKQENQTLNWKLSDNGKNINWSLMFS